MTNKKTYTVNAINNQGCRHPYAKLITAKTLRAAKTLASQSYADGWDLHLWVHVDGDCFCVSSKVDGKWSDAK